MPTATPSVGTELLADIISCPADDVPRLIYSDWLEDQDDKIDALQAAFIRQEMAHPGVIREATFRRQTANVKIVTGAGLVNEITPFAGPLPVPQAYGEEVTYCWRRGFLAEVECTYAEWLRIGPQIAQAHPLTLVTLADREPVSYRSPDAWWLYRDSVASAVTDRRSHLGPIWAHLPLIVATPGQHEYPSRQAAISDLSAACIAWARSVKCLKCNDQGMVSDRGRPVFIPCDCPAGPEYERRLAKYHDDMLHGRDV